LATPPGSPLERLARLGHLDLLDALHRDEDRDAPAVQIACHVGPSPLVRVLCVTGRSHLMGTTRNASQGILADERTADRERIIGMLKKAYWMEIETVMSYIANSINPDGVRAQEIIQSLSQDIQEELGHAQQFATRIKELYGVVPGSQDFKAEQTYLQPPEHQTDVVHVIKGVIEAETGAIEHYNAIIEATEGVDPVTNDMLIAILRDEEGHRRLFEGYLREYEAEGLA
jgi:bacterioferritin